MYERQRQALEYQHVIRGDDRLRMAARIWVLRVERKLQWSEISDITGVPRAKACTMHKQYDKSEFEKYMEEARNE
jgi:hypothetical protein